MSAKKGKPLSAKHKMKISDAMLLRAKKKREVKEKAEAAKKPPDILTALTRAVWARYYDAGDKTSAGVQVACTGIDGDGVPVWYAAVHRYPAGPELRDVVVSTHGSFLRAEPIIYQLASLWFSMAHSHPQVQETQSQLGRTLYPPELARPKKKGRR